MEEAVREAIIRKVQEEPFARKIQCTGITFGIFVFENIRLIGLLRRLETEP